MTNKKAKYVRVVCCERKGSDACLSRRRDESSVDLLNPTCLECLCVLGGLVRLSPYSTAGRCVCSMFYLTRWQVSQYMKTGCAVAMDMVRYILSWFLVPLTNLPSAAASDNSFKRRVRIWEEQALTWSVCQQLNRSRVSWQSWALIIPTILCCHLFWFYTGAMSSLHTRPSFPF